MTTLKLPHDSAWQNIWHNDHHTWCYYAAPGNPAPRPEDAAARIHDGFAKVFGTPLRPISDRCFFTIGSCFARVIERTLLLRGANVPSADLTGLKDVLHLFPTAREDKSVAGFFNRFNLPSMLQELRVLTEGFPVEDKNWLLCENNGKWCDLHYARDFEDVSLEECHERRAGIFRHFSPALRLANTYVLTLGLCEAWFDRSTQAYLNIAPPRRTAAGSDRFEFHFLDYEDNLAALSSIYDLLCTLKGPEGFELIVTVSPVPLNTTFTNSDIVVANTEAKAILRAVAGEAARRFPRVTYFPSYEIVNYSNPAKAWQSDRLHVQLSATNHVVNTFQRLLDPDGGTLDEI